ncbi:MAG: dTMP kinase [Clostridia bacterium]|nr:MAG: dTMP kinase [Clostridia bacterium]
MTFITFEGIEGSGKTTQIKRLLAWLQTKTDKVLLTREPGGTEIGEQIRTILLSPANTDMTPVSEILLFSAARAQIVRQIIRPHLDAGWIVICDRFADSTLAYQGYGHGLPLEDLRSITKFATGGLWPDLTIYLDLDVEAGLRRKSATPEEWNRMEAQAQAFHKRVRQGYLELARMFSDRYLIIDANQPEEVIQKKIQARIKAIVAQENIRQT